MLYDKNSFAQSDNKGCLERSVSFLSEPAILMCVQGQSLPYICSAVVTEVGFTVFFSLVVFCLDGSSYLWFEGD